MASERGKFVVVEGGSGVGKSTQVELLRNTLDGWNFLREPGSTGFGELVREAVQDHPEWKVDKYAALFAYSACRANLVRGVIMPALNEGTDVLLDRYWFSTFAYQGAEGVSKPIIWAVSMLATRFKMPDVVLQYDVLPEIALKRKSGMEGEDRYDMKEVEFHRNVRMNYRQLRRLYPRRWHVIDASGTAEEVFDDTLKVFKQTNMID